MNSKESKESQEVVVQVSITLKTSFKKYDGEDLNKLAMQQIQFWCKEVLEEEDKIPLYVGSEAGEECGPKEIQVQIQVVE
jgi:hypothetical protein